MSEILGKSLTKLIEELEYFMPLKTKTVNKDTVVFLEENKKKNVFLSFGQIISVNKIYVKGQARLAVTVCLFQMPLNFVSLVLTEEQLNGQCPFEQDKRLAYIRALKMDVLAHAFPKPSETGGKEDDEPSRGRENLEIVKPPSRTRRSRSPQPSPSEGAKAPIDPSRPPSETQRDSDREGPDPGDPGFFILERSSHLNANHPSTLDQIRDEIRRGLNKRPRGDSSFTIDPPNPRPFKAQLTLVKFKGQDSERDSK
ncbi:MAG: hypothetical protein LBS60_10590 [Deltaproteobacteria bacterium]|nr:hypothetical protein [Deltaproteobacteria bacterium]